MGREIFVGERNWETVDCRRVKLGSCMVSGVDCMLLGIEWEGRYWLVKGIGKQLTVGDCIVGS